jgi:hypothetical protein
VPTDCTVPNSTYPYYNAASYEDGDISCVRETECFTAFSGPEYPDVGFERVINGGSVADYFCDNYTFDIAKFERYNGCYVCAHYWEILSETEGVVGKKFAVGVIGADGTEELITGILYSGCALLDGNVIKSGDASHACPSRPAAECPENPCAQCGEGETCGTSYISAGSSAYLDSWCNGEFFESIGEGVDPNSGCRCVGSVESGIRPDFSWEVFTCCPNPLP